MVPSSRRPSILARMSGYLVVLFSWFRENIRISPVLEHWICTRSPVYNLRNAHGRMSQHGFGMYTRREFAVLLTLHYTVFPEHFHDVLEVRELTVAIIYDVSSRIFLKYEALSRHCILFIASRRSLNYSMTQCNKVFCSSANPASTWLWSVLHPLSRQQQLLDHPYFLSFSLVST